MQLISLNFLILGGQFQIQKISTVLVIIGRAAIQNDNKPGFLREMVAWHERWDNSKNTKLWNIYPLSSNILSVTKDPLEAVVGMCSVKKVSLEILQNSQESTCARVSFLIKLQTWGLQIY